VDEEYQRRYKRSSRCGTGACVEIGDDERGVVTIRQSRQPTTELVISKAAFVALITALKAGEFTTPRPDGG
jgi:hypothetical protein